MSAKDLEELPSLLKPTVKQRVAWVDILRIFVILWIICMHGMLLGGGWKYIGKLFCSPTVLIFFFFSGVLLKNAASAWKRGLLILAVFAFWGIALKMAVFPLTRFLAALIRGNEATYAWGVLDADFFRNYLFLDLGKLWPSFGYMWFMRALGIFTLLSPLLVRLNKWIILFLGIAFDVWGIFLIDHGQLPQDGPWLPFVMSDSFGAKAFAFFLLGIFVSKCGGITRLTDWLSHIPWWGLLLPFICSLLLIGAEHVGILSPYALISGTEYVPISELSLGCLLSMGIAVHHLHQNTVLLPACCHRIVRSVIENIASLAPCVFTVYILHMALYAVENACYARVPHCPVLDFVRPIFIFAIAYGAFLLMRRVPYCSRMLCFVPAHRAQKGKK